MVSIRSFDDKPLKMQRQGRMGTWGSLRGQEAAQVGVAAAMAPDDWLVPSFREHGLLLLRGVPGHLIYAGWRGDERGQFYPEGVKALPPSVPIGSQLLHGVGLGLALRLRNDPGVVVACGGDGATSQGDFHEALNFAAVFRARTIFLVQNNGWAISLPRSKQTASASIAQKAHSYGLPGIQVDGNDVLAVYAAARELLERARRGDGGGLLEAHTYRMGDHTTADDAGRYRSADEVAAWALRDPILRLRRFLETRGLWSEDRERALLEETQAEVERTVETLEAMPPADPGSIFEHLYAEMTPLLREQQAALRKEVRP